MFLLDTNVVSELRPGKPKQSADVRHWASGIRMDSLFLSALTVLELETGVLAMERRDPRQGLALRSWLRAVLLQFGARVLPFSGETALLCAAMHVPNRRAERDAMIAATAKQFGYTIVTRNTADFEGCAVPLLDPWLPQSAAAGSPS